MRVKTISYSESKESVTAFGLKSWKKLGMEAEVEENDILQTSVAVLKEYVKGMILDEEEVAELADSIGKPKENLDPKEKAIDIMIASINSAKTLKTLEWVKPIGENAKNEKLMSAYMKKHEELYKNSKQ